MIEEVKDRMKRLGISQVAMIHLLHDKGVEVQPPMLSSTLNGVTTYPKCKYILSVCDGILNEIEGDMNA